MRASRNPSQIPPYVDFRKFLRWVSGEFGNGGRRTRARRSVRPHLSLLRLSACRGMFGEFRRGWMLFSRILSFPRKRQWREEYGKGICRPRFHGDDIVAIRARFR